VGSDNDSRRELFVFLLVPMVESTHHSPAHDEGGHRTTTSSKVRGELIYQSSYSWHLQVEERIGGRNEQPWTGSLDR
jgi:hypothetical protein